MKTKNKSGDITTLYIKNMVCNRCIRVVREEMERLGLTISRIDLGEVEVTGKKHLDLDAIESILQENGFELIEDKRVKAIERVKVAILKFVHHDHSVSPMKMKFSRFIALELGQDYHTLSTLFSSVENVTVEQYVILQRIERVKELLKYDELTLSEIAYRMGYSSVQHLSNQFKKVTGLTPSYFKDLKKNVRKPIDQVTTG
jgi:AraC family transcriptional regulator